MDVSAIAQAGVAALRAGDARNARIKFEEILAAGVTDVSVLHALAVACNQLGDFDAMLKAADQALNNNSRHIPCLMLKGDYYSKLGDDRAALSFYNVVVAIAEGEGVRTPEIAQAERRAKQLRAKYVSSMFAHVSERLEAEGFVRGKSSERFSHAIDLLSGAKQLYLQQPRTFYFPELPQIQFYPRSDCPWMDPIEAATDDICAELAAIESGEEFTPYIRRDEDRPIEDQFKLMESMDWSAFFLWRDGAPIPENVIRFPRTMAALAEAPLTRIRGRCPSILFSRLLPGAHIPPHHGMLNTRLICHLPLVVPQGCRFRVGNDVRDWVRGKAWAFDDTIEHEAWNSPTESRIVLIFEVWRPELSEEERALVTTVIEAVDAYSGEKREKWDN